MKTAAAWIAKVRKLGSVEKAQFAARYLKAIPGGYGEGDAFLGVRVPVLRSLARDWKELPLNETKKLVQSKFHEVRLLGLFCLVKRYQRADIDEKQKIFKLYLSLKKHVNNWDLVDSSAPHIVGAQLFNGDHSLLKKWIKSKDLWQRRIALLATQYFIRQNQLQPTFQLARQVLRDKHDLIHKAAGWMLREAGAKDMKLLLSFLSNHAHEMPRTMLRYAIEKLPQKQRKELMGLKTPKGRLSRVAKLGS